MVHSGQRQDAIVSVAVEPAVVTLTITVKLNINTRSPNRASRRIVFEILVQNDLLCYFEREKWFEKRRIRNVI